MAYRIEGQINIPMDEFLEFVSEYIPSGLGDRLYGVPHIVSDDVNTLRINYVENTECHPAEEVERCSVAIEWDKLEENRHD